jgi:2-amino-4-hydroxy-6-hydroxymethyldihydropteridine diphosphokinase
MGEWVYFLLGSNEGDREAFLKAALDALLQSVAAGRPLISSVYETAAWGLEDQPSFLNMAVGMQTRLAPHEVLQITREIEARLGRQRKVVWGQRTLDIDILLFGERIIHTQELHIPHPRLSERRFALTPFAEIAADRPHPVLHKTIRELLLDCRDPLPVHKVPAS